MLHSQVEGFVAVAREGNMRRAALALHITQPALTARIQTLERDMRAQLFRRTRMGMELTHAGRAFLPYAERAISSLDNGRALIQELQEGVSGELLIGAAPAVSAYVLPELLARFTERHPKVRLLVRTGHSEGLVDALLRGETHVAIVRELRDARVMSRPLFEDELVLVARPDHEFAQAASIDVEAMHGAQLILFDRTSSYFELTNALFRAAGVMPRGVIELDNIEAARRMVERGLGVALLPGTAVADALESGTLRRIELRGASTIRRRMVAVERLGAGGQSAAVRYFASLLDQIPELIPGARPVRYEAD